MSEPYSVVIDGTERTYRLHRPLNFDGESLVVFLHGKGGTAGWAETETGWSDLADERGFAVLYPEALPPKRERAPKFLTNPPTWDDLSHTSPDLTYFRKLLEDLPIASTKRYLSGFSNGAAMAFRLAAEMPALFRAIAPVAGYCRFDPGTLPRPIPTLYLIGQDDPLVSLQGGQIFTPWRVMEDRPPVEQGLSIWRQANGFRPTSGGIGPEFSRFSSEFSRFSSEFSRSPAGSQPTWTDFRAESGEIMLVGVIPDLGHHWPGGKGGLGEHFGGPMSDQLNATKLIWEFFQS